MIEAWLPALANLDEDFDVDLTEGLRRASTSRRRAPGEEALLTLHEALMEVDVESASVSSEG